jgi:hypothetical protein
MHSGEREITMKNLYHISFYDRNGYIIDEVYETFSSIGLAHDYAEDACKAIGAYNYQVEVSA